MRRGGETTRSLCGHVGGHSDRPSSCKPRRSGGDDPFGSFRQHADSFIVVTRHLRHGKDKKLRLTFTLICCPISFLVSESFTSVLHSLQNVPLRCYRSMSHPRLLRTVHGHLPRSPVPQQHFHLMSSPSLYFTCCFSDPCDSYTRT